MDLQVVQRIFNKARFEVRLYSDEAARGHHLVNDEPGLKRCKIEILFLHDFVANDVEGIVAQLEMVLRAFILEIFL